MRKWMESVLGLVLLIWVSAPALAVEGDLTISDREIIERLTRLEEGQKALREQMIAGQKALREQMVAGQNGLQSQINSLQNLMAGGFGVIFVGIFGLFGFVIWDRRTALSPVIRKTRELEEDRDMTLKVLKEYAQKEPRLAEVMKSKGLI